MNRENRFKWFFALLSLAWVVFIFANSLQPGADSQVRSDGLLVRILRVFSLEALADSLFLRALIRKIAHLTEYAVLGFLLAETFRKEKHGRLWPILLGIAAASCDEAIQLRVPNRNGSLTDVGIDTCGVLLGLGLVLVIHHLMKKRRKS